MAKRCIESDQFSMQTILDFTDGGRSVDKRYQQQKPAYTKAGPPKPRSQAQEAEAGKAGANRGQSAKPQPNPPRPNDFKIYAPFKSTLPFKDEPRRSLSEFSTQKSQIHVTLDYKQTRATDNIDKRHPFFQMINCHQIPFRLRYTDVVSTLMRLLILVYNKLSELNYTHGTSLKHLVTNLRRMDEHIKEKVFRIVCSDLNLVARRKSHVYLMQVYACLDLPRLPNPNNKAEMKNL